MKKYGIVVVALSLLLCGQVAVGMKRKRDDVEQRDEAAKKRKIAPPVVEVVPEASTARRDSAGLQEGQDFDELAFEQYINTFWRGYQFLMIDCDGSLAGSRFEGSKRFANANNLRWCALRFYKIHQLTNDRMKKICERFPKAVVISIYGKSFLTDECFKFLPQNLFRLNIFNGFCMTDRGIEFLNERCKRLVRLGLYTGNAISVNGFARLPEGVHSLALKRGFCDTESIKSIRNRCKDMKKLELRRCSAITNESLKHLPEGLVVLIVSFSEMITDEAVDIIKKQCPQLEGLSLYGCPNVTNDGVLRLPDTLKWVNVTECPKVTTLAILPLREREITVHVGLPFFKLFGDVVTEIFDYLTLEELCGVRKGSKFLNDCFKQYLGTYARSIPYKIRLKRFAFWKLLKFFSGVYVCPKNEIFLIFNTYQEKCGNYLKRISYYPFIKGVNLSAVQGDGNITADLLEGFLKAKKDDLKHLSLTRYKFADQGEAENKDAFLQLLSPEMETLTLNGSEWLTNNGMRHIASRCKKLRALDIGDCRNLTTEGLNHLPESLEHLFVDTNQWFDDEGLRAILKQCKNLKSLVISVNSLLGLYLTSLEINKILSDLPRTLKRLGLQGCSLTRVGIKNIAECCPELEELSLDLCYRTSVVIYGPNHPIEQAFGSRDNPQIVEQFGTIRDWLSDLNKGCPKLKVLSVGNCGAVVDDDFKHLPEGLREFTITGVLGYRVVTTRDVEIPGAIPIVMGGGGIYMMPSTQRVPTPVPGRQPDQAVRNILDRCKNLKKLRFRGEGAVSPPMQEQLKQRGFGDVVNGAWTAF